MVEACVQRSGPNSPADTHARKPSPSTCTARSTSSRKRLSLRAKSGVVNRIYLHAANVKSPKGTGLADILVLRRSVEEEGEDSSPEIQVHQELVL